MADEEWRTTVESPMYEVSSFGNIRRKGLTKLLTLNVAQYVRTTMYVDKKPSTFMVHRVVANAFIDRIDGKNVIDHIDRNKHNNNVSNLRWCTQQENLWNKVHKGCHKPLNRRKWYSAIRDNTGKKVFLGSFDTEEEASGAYQMAALRLRGRIPS